ncbi:hypothetical protein SAMN04487792_1562 [Lactobacillus bombicola]|uniref:Cyanophage baseplate Pam3 plug gp18 domain-containing protein n=1 Tax=Lactobacillus bombicola TaxID=1505723 RepID=A0A1I1TU51_9LACO|nr:hypothetical protein [Lactobacillus bombicola]SFD60768.1 hypothetical protein SAMN04487792_1562 [Lactobacillus bombicola]
MRQYVPIDTDNLPDIFDITLAGDLYVFRVDYNSVADFYTATIQKDGRTIVTQEPLVLGQLVAIDIPDPDLPTVDLRVIDETGQAKDAGEQNFGDLVQIYLDVVDPNGSETADPTITPFGYDPDEDSDDETDDEVAI